MDKWTNGPMEPRSSLVVAIDWSSWSNGHRARRGDERSCSLFRLRARVMAEAALELASERHRLERGRAVGTTSVDDIDGGEGVTGSECGGAGGMRPRQHYLRPQGDKRQCLEGGVGEGLEGSCATNRRPPRVGEDLSRGSQRSPLTGAPVNGHPCGADRPDLGAPRCDSFSLDMTTVDASTAVAVAHVSGHVAGGGSGGVAATLCVSPALTGGALQETLRNANVPVRMRNDSTTAVVAEAGVLPGGPKPSTGAEEAAVVGGNCGDAPGGDGHQRKEEGAERRPRAAAESSAGAEAVPLSAPASVRAGSRGGGGALRGAVAAVAGQTLLKDGRASTDDFRGERRREVVAREPLWSQGERPAFVVVGLVGEVGDRVLLLPTSKRRCETVGESPAMSVMLNWNDGNVDQRLVLTRTKRKPDVCNPLPALATVLAWARELGPGALPTTNLPFLPKILAPHPPPHATDVDDDGAVGDVCDARDPKLSAFRGKFQNAKSLQTPPPSAVAERSDGVSKNGSNDSVVVSGDSSCVSPVSPSAVGEGGQSSRSGGRTLSVGGAWMLAHMAFGRRGMREPAGAWRPHQGVVDISAGEANALGLLSCPDVGWAPEPREVMQALLDGGGGSLCGYTVSAEGMEGGRRWAEAACEELVEAGLGVRGHDRGLLRLDREVERSFDLSIKVFVNRWNPPRETLASVALGLTKTGPMTVGVLPQPMQLLLDRRTPGFTCAKNDGVVVREENGEGHCVGGRISGRVGVLCVKLHSWCLEVRGTVGGGIEYEGLLWQLQKAEIPGDRGGLRVWAGPMAEALSMLGGGGVGFGVEWMACMSRQERVLDTACVRLKDAVAEVVEVFCGLVNRWQQDKNYREAVMILRLLVRHDKGLAGAGNVEVPDLQWASGWCSSRFRGHAWIRLSLNLEHLGEYEACLEAVRSAHEDGHVRGGDLIEVRQRLASKYRHYGNPEDTPPASPLRKESEELIVTAMSTGKQGNRRNTKGGRIFFFDNKDDSKDGNGACLPRGRRAAKKGLTVEGVVLKEKRSEGGWAGLHCESDLIVGLMMLLLWEDLFDPTVAAACGHCFTKEPLDMYDAHLWSRRKGLPKRLDAMAKAGDEELWNDVGQRYDRYEGVMCARCDWRRFSKQQMMEIAVAFGGWRLAYVLRVLAKNLPDLNYGFPDLVLWRPKGRPNPRKYGDGTAWNGREFGLGWDGNKGLGWEVQVVEVKSEGDTLSAVQRAWLSVLRDAGVAATVCRVASRAKPR